MKNLILSISIIICGINATAQPVEIKHSHQPKMEFETEVIDYGTIEQYANGIREFKFTNTGTEPLIISRAQQSCGCTVPSWPREPIAPGASGELKVKYDTKRIGLINKSVTIQSNAVTNPTKIIRIKGEIKAPDATASPIKPVEGPVNN